MPLIPYILFEGVEDEAFLKALIENRHLGDFSFHGECEGNTSFTKYLKGLRLDKNISNTSAIIIVADNDGNPGNSFAAIQGQIANAGYNVPQNPRQRAEQVNLPPLYVLMLPWDYEMGCLETLCLNSAANRSPHELACVEQFIDCVHARAWDVAKLAKLKLRCYLSSVCKGKPNTSLRYAWSRPENPIPINDPCFNNVSDFLAGI